MSPPLQEDSIMINIGACAKEEETFMFNRAAEKQARPMCESSVCRKIQAGAISGRRASHLVP